MFPYKNVLLLVIDDHDDMDVSNKYYTILKIKFYKISTQMRKIEGNLGASRNKLLRSLSRPYGKLKEKQQKVF